MQGTTYVGMLKKPFVKLQQNKPKSSDVNSFKESEKNHLTQEEN